MMSHHEMSRDDILDELELLPVWQLREPAGVNRLAKDTQSEINLIDTQAKINSPKMNLIVSEDSRYACFFTDFSAYDNASEHETLLQNMFKAISFKPKMGLTDFTLDALMIHSSQVIIALGEVAAKTLIPAMTDLEHAREVQHQADFERHLYQNVPIVVSYDTAALLQHLPNKAKAWDDLRLAMRISKI